jgi:anaerobic selenocysteine-containing dehydrogenase
MISNGSIMTASGMPNRLKALKARGGKMVVIDPRRTETARKADKHLFIRPGTDVYLLAAMLKIMLSDDRTVALPPWAKGLGALREAVSVLSLDRVSKITGISEEAIRDITNEFLSAESAVCYGRTGVSVQEYGTLCQWLVNAVNIVSGNFDKAGGAMFPKPAIEILNRSKKGTMHRYNRWQSRVRKLPETGGELPVAALAEECLTPGAGQVRALVCVAGNPVLSTPNGRHLEKALEQLEFMVGIDIYINETTRFADVILPPATGLETPHYALAFQGLAVRNTVKYSPALFEKEKGMRYDWQIFKALAGRFRKKRFSIKNMIYNWLTPERMIDIGLRTGPYRLSLSRLRKHPHGIDLGPMKPQFPGRLFTRDKKADMAPEIFTEELKNAIQNVKVPKDGIFLLIGRRHLRSNNSWMHNSIRLVKGPDRCTILMHPSDARKYKIADGDMVKVHALRTGEEVEIACRVTDEIMPGVVSIPHGWGHHRRGTRWKTAEAFAGVSVNDLTDERLTDSITGNAAFNGVEVEIVI